MNLNGLAAGVFKSKSNHCDFTSSLLKTEFVKYSCIHKTVVRIAKLNVTPLKKLF